MARVQNTLIGRASGSVGNVVFLTWRGINVTRSKPLSVANPNTTAQQTQRNRFAQIVGLYQILKPILSVGLINRNRKMTLFNAFQHENQQEAFVDIGGGVVEIVPDKLKISKGLMEKTSLDLVLAVNGNSGITAYWSMVADNMSQSANDELYVVIHNVTQNDWVFRYGDRLRFWGFVVIDDFMPLVTGDELFIWVFFKKNGSKVISDSTFFQKTVTAM